MTLPQDVRFDGSIPVIRMLDEAKARAFYIEYLGFEIDWEHRSDPSSKASPLYMQIHLGKAMLHLNGHAESEAPTTEVRIPVHGLETYCEYLRSKTASGDMPTIVDPRYEGKGTDLNLCDPSGNLLVFWLAQ